MTGALFGGIATGLVLSLSLGPVFFTLIQITVEKGFSRAIYFILGISFTDISITLILWFGLKQLQVQSENPIMTIAAASILTLFGLSFILKKGTLSSYETKEVKSIALGNSGLFLKAVLIDALNPLVWVFWAAVVEYSISNFDSETNQLIYFAAFLVTIFSTDLLKSYFANKLRSLISYKYIKYLNYGVGLLLIGFGVKLFFI